MVLPVVKAIFRVRWSGEIVVDIFHGECPLAFIGAHAIAKARSSLSS